MNRRKVFYVWGFLVLLISAAGALLPEVACCYDDNSSGFVQNIPGYNREFGENVRIRSHAGGLGMCSECRVSGVEKVAFQNRLFTFVGVGSFFHELRYYWDEGQKNPDVHQHDETKEEVVFMTDFDFIDSPFFSFRTCVFNGQLYLFFAVEKDGDEDLEGGVIYSMKSAATDQGKPLKFQGEADPEQAFAKKQKILEGVQSPLWLCAAKVMNDRMYLFFAKESGTGFDWYVTSTADGEKWTAPTSNWWDVGFPQSAVTYAVPDQGDGFSSERIALGSVRFQGADHGTAHLIFFKANNQGQHAAIYDGLDLKGADTNHITVALGTVKGAVNDRQVIHIWHTDPEAGGMKRIWHGQYLIGGPDGTNGYLIPSSKDGKFWTLLQQEGWQYKTARVCGQPGNDGSRFWPGNRWMVGWNVATPFDYDENKEFLQQYLDLTFVNHWTNWFLYGYNPAVKTLRYTSDIMQPDGKPRVLDSWDPNYREEWKNLWHLLGVVEGPPPIPGNGHALGELDEKFSSAKVGQNEKELFKETFTAKESVQIGFSGGKWDEKAPSMGASFSIGAQFMQNRDKTKSLSSDIYKTVTIDTTSNPPSDDVGQLVLLRPQIKNRKYKVFGYDGQYQVGPEYNFLSMPQARITCQAYSLTNPDRDWFSQGMAARYKTTDYLGWSKYDPPLKAADYTGRTASGALEAGQGHSSSITLNNGETETETDSYGFSVKGGLSFFPTFAKALDIGVKYDLSFDWAVSTVKEISNSVSWNLKLPTVMGPPRVEEIKVQPYLLQAKSAGKTAWWIPEFFRGKGLRPWCITYHVSEFREKKDDLTDLGLSLLGVEPALLTLTVPDNGGYVTSATLMADGRVETSGQFEVLSQVKYDLRAFPDPGYVFDYWDFGSPDLMDHGPAEASDSWIALKQGGSMSTLQAVFRKIPFSVAARLDDLGESSIEINEVFVDEHLLGFDPAVNRLKVFLNEFSYLCSRETGTWWKTSSGYAYESGEPAGVSLGLDFEARKWTLRVTGKEVEASLRLAGSNLKVGLIMDGRSYPDKAKAEWACTFKASRIDSPPRGKQRLKVLLLEGRDGNKTPAQNTLTARGIAHGVRSNDWVLLRNTGVVAFYLGADLILEAKGADFALSKNILSYEKSSKKGSAAMKINTATGNWSLKVSDPRLRPVPEAEDSAYLFLYEEPQTQEPPLNVGLGTPNRIVLWGAGDRLKIQRSATLDSRQ
jgi:hypothetical protein